MIEKVLSKANMQKALNMLLTEKNHRGYDEVNTHDLPEFTKLNLDEIIATIRDGTYRPGKVDMFERIDKHGKKRFICNMSAMDRLIAKSIYLVIYDKIAPLIHENSFAFQKGKSLVAAAQQCRTYITYGNEFVVQADIKNYYDTINRPLLRKLLTNTLQDASLADLIMKLLTADVIHQHQVIRSTRGIIQGCTLSPIVSELYLVSLDQYLTEQGYLFVRFCDDIKVFVPDVESGLEVLSNITSFLTEHLMLQINEEKSNVCPYITARYFGYRMSDEDSGFIKLISPGNNRNTWSEEWNTSALIMQDGEITLEEDGVLRQKDYSLLFENEETKKHFPVCSINEINIFSDISLSPKFFDLMEREHLDVNFYNSFGEYIGTFTGASSVSDSSVLIKQCVAYNDNETRLRYAIIFETAAIRNILAVLRYYRKRKPDNQKLVPAIFQIEEILRSIPSCKTIDACFQHEARARKIYYQTYQQIINNPAFTFIRRERKPPKDPVNAMLSYGNTFLYNRITTLIAKSKLDNRISFVHSSTTHGQAKLTLDLSDIYKPIIIDRTIFTLVNKHMLSPEKHFEPHGTDGVYLNQEGRRIFTTNLKNKLSSKITDSDDVAKSYITLIKQDISSLVNSLKTDDPSLFTPFICKG